jgi:catechol 2,3-dioxygenase-like lactoylglutathione lyase family enzyme
MEFKFEHIHVKTRDPRKAAKFYLEALGATLISESPEGDHFRISLHGVTMNITDHVTYQKRKQYYGLEHVAVHTSDMDATLAKLKEQGATLLEEFISPVPSHKGGRVCFLEGPEGIQLELVEMKA